MKYQVGDIVTVREDLMEIVYPDSDGISAPLRAVGPMLDYRGQDVEITGIFGGSSPKRGAYIIGECSPDLGWTDTMFSGIVELPPLDFETGGLLSMMEG